jgi:hypothetical protein
MWGIRPVTGEGWNKMPKIKLKPEDKETNKSEGVWTWGGAVGLCVSQARAWVECHCYWKPKMPPTAV